MRMIAYMIIAILLIQTCHCGSSNNSADGSNNTSIWTGLRNAVNTIW
ncbi:hypothetical protein KSF78_0008984 [Schistosoma japonicum]|nr:hypothetical protein KSF78_0008984 [Schistosoma japonicum]